MTFWDHLDELRGTIVRSVVAICVLSVLGFVFKSFLFQIVLAPTRPDFWLYKALGWRLSMDLINIDVTAQFFVHLKASLSAGLVLAFPYVVWEIWRFLAPALYENETRPVRSAFLMSAVLFYLGVVVGYCFVLPVCLQFFLNYSIGPEVVNTISLGSYMSLFMSMVLMIGIVFEFPTVVVVLSRLGILPRSVLRKGRKYAVVVVMVLAALITPSDPFSMMVLAVPLYFLYEFSILCASDPKPEQDE